MGGALAGLALFASGAQAQTSAPAPADLASAIQGGSLIFEARARHESAEIGGAADADALTLRTRLGWQTAPWRGLVGVIEFEDVRALVDDYNDGVPPAEPFATIADPEVTELNRLQLAWTAAPGFTATLGRQRIAFDDQRFVGSVAWRQDEQTFDAVRLDFRRGPFTASYAYVDHVNRIFAEELDWDSQSSLLNASYAFAAPFKLTLFAYLLDFDGAGAAQSNATYGARVSGTANAAGVRLDYAATYATQSDYGANPIAYDADFYGVDLTATRGPLALRLGYESLEGNGPGQRFITPLATLHAFQGWADVFLNTPDAGVEDAYAGVTFKPDWSAQFLSAPAFTLVWHDYEAEGADADLGDEINFLATASITRRLGVLVKYADYNGTGTPADATRTWFGLEFKL
ncbi:MAG: alginate export family protein [Hydrogenophilaceae bacterium]|jgi:hypothetical protein|nr:alginate export family protein [Hydrogenophilaceae bacterium]